MLKVYPIEVFIKDTFYNCLLSPYKLERNTIELINRNDMLPDVVDEIMMTSNIRIYGSTIVHNMLKHRLVCTRNLIRVFNKHGLYDMQSMLKLNYYNLITFNAKKEILFNMRIYPEEFYENKIDIYNAISFNHSLYFTIINDICQHGTIIKEFKKYVNMEFKDSFFLGENPERNIVVSILNSGNKHLINKLIKIIGPSQIIKHVDYKHMPSTTGKIYRNLKRTYMIIFLIFIVRCQIKFKHNYYKFGGNGYLKCLNRFEKNMIM